MLLRNGSLVSIGPLAAGDDAAIATWFAGLGPETRRARFLTSLKRLDRRTQAELARVDHVDHEAIAARTRGGATVGIARYLRDGGSSTAEVAVAIADAWRGNGIASILLDRTAARARAAGIKQLTATCLATNEPIIRLLSRLGETSIGPSVAGVVDLKIDLTRPALHDRARSASRGETSRSSRVGQ